MLERSVDVFPHVIARDVDLEAAGGILQRGKAGLAHDALEHHAAGDAGGDLPVFGVGLVQLFLGLAIDGSQQVGSAVGRFEVVGERHALALGLGGAQRLELLAALGDQLVVINGGGCGSLGGVLLFGHGWV